MVLVIVVKNDFFLSPTETARIESAIGRANNLVEPYAETGELVILYRLPDRSEFGCAYHATLDDGAGNSCAWKKIHTLLEHKGVLSTGQLTESALGVEEVCYYGSNRLFGAMSKSEYDEKHGVNILHSIGPVEILIAFSDRKEWQDELYVAAVRQILATACDFRILPDSLDKDPVIGTARRIIREIL